MVAEWLEQSQSRYLPVWDIVHVLQLLVVYVTHRLRMPLVCVCGRFRYVAMSHDALDIFVIHKKFHTPCEVVLVPPLITIL